MTLTEGIALVEAALNDPLNRTLHLVQLEKALGNEELGEFGAGQEILSELVFDLELNSIRGGLLEMFREQRLLRSALKRLTELGLR